MTEVQFTFDGERWLAHCSLWGANVWAPLPFTGEASPKQIRDSLTTRFPNAKITHITGG